MVKRLIKIIDLDILWKISYPKVITLSGIQFEAVLIAFNWMFSIITENCFTIDSWTYIDWEWPHKADKQYL